jgi:hypothetical protein
MKIRDAIVELEMSICKMSDRCTEAAKSHALTALDGDESAEKEARRYKAMTEAYSAVMQLTTELRVKIEKGEVS